jgi:hypothetical protein
MSQYDFQSSILAHWNLFDIRIKPHYFFIGPCTSQLPLENEFAQSQHFLCTTHNRNGEQQINTIQERKGTRILIVHSTSHQSKVLYILKEFLKMETMKHNNIWKCLCVWPCRWKKQPPPPKPMKRKKKSSVVIPVYCIHFQLKDTMIPLRCYGRQVMSLLLK